MRRFLLFVTILISTQLTAQQRPTLVVGIVVDQMRNDYIYRYWNRFGEGGFKRLVSQGFYFRNAHYNYSPTYTGPGHASIYTGATPRSHGIVGNEWYDRASGKKVYCAADTNVKPVGTANRRAAASPHRLLCPTLADELRLANGKASRIYSIAAKDRSAVLPAGHAADGVFWEEEGAGGFVTSTWYADALPAWVTAFNARNYPETLLAKGWDLLYAKESYTTSMADSNPYEESIQSDKKEAVFPYNFAKQVAEKKFATVYATPFGNTITKDLAVECLNAAELGRRGVTDLLLVSFSSPDILGHAVGPRAMETEDMYLRLDRDIAALLTALDKAAPGKYTVFLTADHGGADVPNYLRDLKMPAGYVYRDATKKALRKFAATAFGDSLVIASVTNEQVYLDHAKLSQLNFDRTIAGEKVAVFLRGVAGIADAFTTEELRNAGSSNEILRSAAAGHHSLRSGDVTFALLPSHMDNGPRGTTHGTVYNYDTHVPVIFYGAGIKKGESMTRVAITQIAPTLAELMRIARPACAEMEVLTELFR